MDGKGSTRWVGGVQIVTHSGPPQQELPTLSKGGAQDDSRTDASGRLHPLGSNPPPGSPTPNESTSNDVVLGSTKEGDYHCLESGLIWSLDQEGESSQSKPSEPAESRENSLIGSSSGPPQQTLSTDVSEGGVVCASGMHAPGSNPPPRRIPKVLTVPWSWVRKAAGFIGFIVAALVISSCVIFSIIQLGMYVFGGNVLVKDRATCLQWHPAESAALGPKQDLDIHFFHGLQLKYGENARNGTWTNGDGVLWPRDYLPGLLAPYSVRIFGVEYNAVGSWLRFGNKGVTGPGHKRIAHSLFHTLVKSDRCLLGSKPFVVVGHSYGGLIIKSVVVQCDDVIKKYKDVPPSKPGHRLGLEAAIRFKKNFRGYVFYGVPQLGSTFSIYAGFIPGVHLGKILMNDLVPLDEEILDLTRRFEESIKDQNVMQFAFGETMEYGLFWPLKGMVVNRASARGHLHETEFMELDGYDHISMVKPRTIHAEAVQMCGEVIRGILKGLEAESTER